MTPQKLTELNNVSIAASAVYEKAYEAAQEAAHNDPKNVAVYTSKCLKALKKAESAYDAFVAAKAQYESELAAAKNNALSHRIDKATFALDSVLMLQGHNFNDATRGALEYVLTTLHEVSKTR